MFDTHRLYSKVGWILGESTVQTSGDPCHVCRDIRVETRKFGLGLGFLSVVVTQYYMFSTLYVFRFKWVPQSSLD